MAIMTTFSQSLSLLLPDQLADRVHHQDVAPAGGRQQRLQLLHLPPPPQELPRRHLAPPHLQQPARRRPLRLRHGQVPDHEDHRHHQAQPGIKGSGGSFLSPKLRGTGAMSAKHLEAH